MPEPANGGRNLRRRVVGGVVLLVFGVTTAVLALHFWHAGDPGTDSPSSQLRPVDPRDTYEGPYLNVRKDVRYVDDARCAECHAEHAESYGRHPMGRSIALVGEASEDGALTVEQYDAAHGNPFKWKGYTYRVQRDGRRVVHTETRYDNEGELVSSAGAEIKYAIGSGSHARSYLFERDGHLFYSPISWYAREQTWDISPAFTSTNYRFTHAISHRCAFCHVNRIERQPRTVKQFRIVGGAIGCQRCHGPGELHVRRQEQAEAYDGQDYTIVNPGKLPPVLRDSVCEQCHLEGDDRFPRRGRDEFDFRPGLPLHRFVAIYARSKVDEDGEFLRHVEQMRISRCYVASNGKMGCISCHDPHLRPAREDRAEHFAGRCQKCHHDNGCSKPLEERLNSSARNDCRQCHMPARESANVAHVAITDHRIPRIAGDFEAPKQSPPKHGVDSLLVRNMYSHLIDGDDGDSSRDLGIALARLARQFDAESRQAWLAQQSALPLLITAVNRDPQDAEAWGELGQVYEGMNQNQQAMDAYERALAIQPDYAVILNNAGRMALYAGRPKEARQFWRRAVATDPVNTVYRFGLASALLDSGEIRAAVKEFEKVLEWNPAETEAQLQCGDAHYQLGQYAEAIERYELALQHDPKLLVAREKLGVVFFEQKAWQKALDQLLLVLEGDPGNGNARQLAVRCYESLGDSRSAAEHRRWLQGAQGLRPGGP